MTETTQAAAVPAALRELILKDPDAVLHDPQLMAALIAADDGLRGGNVIDLRGLAIARLEERLERLETTHQDVLSAAYENVATTRQVHRALLAMIAPLELDPFLRCLSTDVADILRIASVRLLLEPKDPASLAAIADPHGIIVPSAPGDVELYVNVWRSGRSPDVVLRRTSPDLPRLHDETSGPIRSEALVRLELGDDFSSSLLVLGATSGDQYLPSHATDLINLFGRTFERTLRGLLP